MNEPVPPGSNGDRELYAMATILKSLEGLDGESIQRVMDYVFNRLSLSRPSAVSGSSILSVQPPEVSGAGTVTSARQMSIKDLKDEKQPDSSNQMAALVAYYLAEVAPEYERRPTINSQDIEKFFKQARFNLPKKLNMALPNAAAAGYLDAVGSGNYKLNPVGYNLVAHGLPRMHTSSGKRK
jgi:hypothetical protein